jgi:hypothetical protein
MKYLTRALTLIFAFLAGAGAASPQDRYSDLHYKAVLTAGDWSSPAFDHATEAVRDRLLAHHAAPQDIQRLSASQAVVTQDEAASSTLKNVLSAIERLKPGPGQGCFVFATSHGAYEEGLVLVPSQNYLTPEALDAALKIGCGNAPTVVIVSACFSGIFAKPPMTKANRIILTAAREDRSSFGCGARFQYTFYDRCLLQGMDRSATWQAAFQTIRTCVLSRENALHFQPSGPQAAMGEAVADLPVPGLP